MPHLTTEELKKLRERITKGQLEYVDVNEGTKTYVYAPTCLVAASILVGDARLLAAAPDLLDELIELREWKENLEAAERNGGITKEEEQSFYKKAYGTGNPLPPQPGTGGMPHSL